MEGYEVVVWVLIALPVLMGLIAYWTNKKNILLAIVCTNTIIMVVFSLYLIGVLQDHNIAYGGYLKITTESLAEDLGLGAGPENSIHTLIIALDILLLVFFTILGLYIKSPAVVILGIGQLIPLLWFEISYPEATQVFAFALDYLSLIFVLICSIIGSLIAIYGVKYMEDEKKQGPFFFFILMFLGVMNGAILSNNMIYLYFFWECTTLCCYYLIKHDNTKVAKANARWALEVTMAGGAALLLGTIMFQYYGTGTLSLIEVVYKENIGGIDIFVTLPLFFFALAAFTKSAQVPFQSWLLGAMVAPTPVSALLHSSTMVKLGVYLIIRLYPIIHQFPLLAILIAIVGCYSFLSTSILALQENMMKRLLALSTVGNLGLIIMLSSVGTKEAVVAAVILTIFHAISKALLFLSAGAVHKIFHRKDIEGTEGLFKRTPSLFGAFFIGMITMFMAPFGVFIAKYTALAESIANPLLIIIVVLGSIAAEVFYVRWLGRTMAITGKTYTKKISPLYTYPMWTLALGAIVLSILIPIMLGGIINPIVGENKIVGVAMFDILFAQLELGVIGLIPVLAILSGLILILAYSFHAGETKKVKPYTCGMDKYEYALANPYFDRYVSKKKMMHLVESIGLLILILTLLAAIPLEVIV